MGQKSAMETFVIFVAVGGEVQEWYLFFAAQLGIGPPVQGNHYTSWKHRANICIWWVGKQDFSQPRR